MGDLKVVQISDEYRLRPATEADAALLAEWIEGDPAHRGLFTPKFFIEGRAGKECYAVEGTDGKVRFYITMQKAMRLHIQFNPDGSQETRESTRDALLKGFQWLEQGARRAGIRELIFDSAARPLIAFCRKRLGFGKASDQMIRSIPTIKA